MQMEHEAKMRDEERAREWSDLKQAQCEVLRQEKDIKQKTEMAHRDIADLERQRQKVDEVHDNDNRELESCIMLQIADEIEDGNQRLKVIHHQCTTLEGNVERELRRANEVQRDIQGQEEAIRLQKKDLEKQSNEIKEREVNPLPSCSNGLLSLAVIIESTREAHRRNQNRA